MTIAELQSRLEKSKAVHQSQEWQRFAALLENDLQRLDSVQAVDAEWRTLVASGAARFNLELDEAITRQYSDWVQRAERRRQQITLQETSEFRPTVVGAFLTRLDQVRVTLDLRTRSEQTPWLRQEEDGAVRVGKSRVTLDQVLREFERGVSTPEIARQYDTLDLADVQAAIAYSQCHANEVRAYLSRRAQESAQLRRQVEARQPQTPAMLADLKERWRQRENGSAPTAE